ncbi:MAG TPA: hypothetical protein VGJ94_10610 [Syntrophorhabdaceae bacterium]|jgi:hypothetical protein
MKKYIGYAALAAFLIMSLSSGTATAANGNSAPSIENIPVVIIEPLPPGQTGEMPMERAEMQAPQAPNQRNGGTAVFFDIMILRPAGVLAVAGGLIASAIALPFALPTGSMGKVAKTMIEEPFCYTFARPVGNIDPYPSSYYSTMR